MKKYTVISTAFLAGLLTFSSQAQEDMREKVYFGLKAGVNVANVYDEEAEDFQADPKTGFAAGAFFSFPLAKPFAIQPEIMYSQKGMQATGTVASIPYELKRTINYLDVPILFAFRPTDFLSIYAGPQFSFKLSQQDQYTFGNSSTLDEQQFDNDNIRKNMLGIHFGLDLNYQHFVLSPRASFDLQDNNGDGTSTDPRYKNYVLQLTVGYRF